MPKTFYVGIKGLIVANNKILLLKCKDKNGNDYWDLPGGRMEDGETISDALERELREELPSIANITIDKLQGAFKLARSLPDGQGLMLLMYTVHAHLPQISLSDEHTGYKWIAKDELHLLEQEAHIHNEYKEIIYQSLG